MQQDQTEQGQIVTEKKRRTGITRNTEQIALRLPHELKAEIDNLSASRGISRTTILLEGAQLFMLQFAENGKRVKA